MGFFNTGGDVRVMMGAVGVIGLVVMMMMVMIAIMVVTYPHACEKCIRHVQINSPFQDIIP